jgi:prepilin-type N-terminal cleavage/methylation domain-containing protein
MIVLKKNKVNKEEQGFTLIELVVVIAGLSALAAFTIPNILNTLKLNRIEEAKALMNSFAADCLGQYRISTDPVKFVDNAVPADLDNEKLLTLGYQIDGDKSKCSLTAIKPSDEKEKFLYAFDFRISSEGKVLKTATPSDSPSALNSCKGWAGSNCGLSEDQKAEFARLEALAKAKATCISNYQTWLGKDSSGEYVSWDNNNETCSKKVFAFEGTPVANQQAIDDALKAKYGRACELWRSTKITNGNYVTPGGNPETKSPECGGVKYWFHTGREFTNKADWTKRDNESKKAACEANKSKDEKSKTGKYVYGPTPGPDPCGKVIWLCKGNTYTTEADYKTTSCGAPPPPPPPPKPKPKPPKAIVNPVTREKVTCPGSKPNACNNPAKKWRVPECLCWNNL